MQDKTFSRKEHTSGIAALLIAPIGIIFFAVLIISPLGFRLTPVLIFLIALLPAIAICLGGYVVGQLFWLDRERISEAQDLFAESTEGAPPQRDALKNYLKSKNFPEISMIDCYLIGFSQHDGGAVWLSNQQICRNLQVTGDSEQAVNSFLDSIIMQQLIRNRCSGLTLIDTETGSQNLSRLIMMAELAGRSEDLIVLDPFNQKFSYNFLNTTQSADIKTNKILKAISIALPDFGNQNDDYVIATDLSYRIVRALEATSKSWSLDDFKMVLSDFDRAYDYLKKILSEKGSSSYQTELDLLYSKFRNYEESDINRNYQRIAMKILEALSGSFVLQHVEQGSSLSNEINLTEAISRGKIIYFRVSTAENVNARDAWLKIFLEDLAASIIEIKQDSALEPDDPHLIFLKADSSLKESTLPGTLADFENHSFGMIARAGIEQQLQSESSFTAFSKIIIEDNEQGISDSQPAEVHISDSHTKLASLDIGEDLHLRVRYLSFECKTSQEWQASRYIANFRSAERDDLDLARYLHS